MYEEIKETLKKTLSERRYTHSLGVADEAKRLANIYGESEERAYLAGLLHDCAKEFKNQAEKCDELGVWIDDMMRQTVGLIHGPLGAAVAKRDFGVQDEEILSAIKWHTVGNEKMTVLEKIIYIADMTEANRDFDGVDKLREVVDTDLDEAILISIQEQLARFINRRSTIHPNTISMWNSIVSNKK